MALVLCLAAGDIAFWYTERRTGRMYFSETGRPAEWERSLSEDTLVPRRRRWSVLMIPQVVQKRTGLYAVLRSPYRNCTSGIGHSRHGVVGVVEVQARFHFGTVQFSRWVQSRPFFRWDLQAGSNWSCGEICLVARARGRR